MNSPDRAIPFVDVRHTGPVALVQEYDHLARDLLARARTSFGRAAEMASYAAFPVGDWLARRFLEKNNNPYLKDIADIARILKQPGIFALNLSYEWGCTVGIQRQGQGFQMLRTLDWPFPGLGEHLIVTHEAGPAGDFYNLTWPGMMGVFTALAPSRFAIAINQAPMLARTGLRPVDWILNRFTVSSRGGLPPAHLLRHVLEHAENYRTALQMLIHTPLCTPVIFSLTGIRSEEACIIERQEKEAYLRPYLKEPLSTANHWEITPTALPWRPREPDSHGRKGLMNRMLQMPQAEDFSWLKEPILNGYTKLAAVMNAQTGQLRVQGFEGTVPCTRILSL